MALLPVSCKNGARFVRSSHEIRTKFVRISYEFRANFVRISSHNTYRECGCYEFRPKFVRSSSNLHEFVSFLCVCGCAWTEGLLFVWARVHGVCVPG